MSNACRHVLGGLLCALVVVGCGEDVDCPSEIVLVIADPKDGAVLSEADDTSPDDEIQIDVTVRSNLLEGESVELLLQDSGGDGIDSDSQPVGEDGSVTFFGMTVPNGDVAIVATGTSDACDGSAQDRVDVFVSGDGLCEVSILNGPLDNPNFAPVGVLNLSNDSDVVEPGFQAQIQVGTLPGFEAELIVLDGSTGEEISRRLTAAPDGAAVFDETLAQGTQALRAICRAPQDAGQSSAASESLTVFVDTIAPQSCSLDVPAPFSSLTPDDDEDNDLSNGIQITMRGTASASDNDIEGQPGLFSIGNASTEGTALLGGVTTAPASIGSPGPLDVSFSIEDYAGNSCSSGGVVEVEVDGCPITHVAPVGIVTSDASASPGLQTTVQVQIDTTTSPECAGLTATTDCGSGGAAQVPGSGFVSILVTLSADDAAEGSIDCQTRVTHPSGFTTFASTTIDFDTLGPDCDLELVNPATTCGSTIALSDDVDPSPGIQIDVRTLSQNAALRQIDVNGVIVPADAGGNARITLHSGANAVSAVAQDGFGNECRAPAGGCALVVSDLEILLSPPIDDGNVGIPDDDDGNVSAGVTLDLCGTVADSTATVTVAIDGGAAQTATTPGDGTWCLQSQTLVAGGHSLLVTANAVSGFGQESLALDVDVTPPPTPGNLVLSVPNRQALGARWTAPNDAGAAAAGYLARVSTAPFSEGNFEINGVPVATAAPSVPGQIDSAVANQLRPGVPVFFAVAATDAAGNRSLIAGAGPVIPDFDVDPVRLSPTPGGPANDNALGHALARGLFDDDEFYDLAVAAPFGDSLSGAGTGNVYIYLGTSVGFPTTPDITITGSQIGGNLGSGIAVLRWDADARDDLAIGAPGQDGDSGRVYIFSGTTLSAATTHIDVSADVIVTVNSAAPNYFSDGECGTSLAALRFDGDARDDLAVGCPQGGGNNGGVTVLFGGSTDAVIALSDISAAGFGDTVAVLVDDPDTGPNDRFGELLFNLGPTQVSDSGDDLGVSYASSDAAVFIRGVNKPGVAGVTARPFSAVTDTVLVDGSAGAGTRFGAAMSSVPDVDGDGARDIAISDWRTGDGVVYIVDGNEVGNQTVAATAITTITSSGAVPQLGQAIANNPSSIGPDVDNDGIEDLVVIAGAGNVDALIWFGDALPVGSVDETSAEHAVLLPTEITADNVASTTTPIAAAWIGDLNADGLTDLCVGNATAQSNDGAFTVLWDDGQ